MTFVTVGDQTVELNSQRSTSEPTMNERLSEMSAMCLGDMMRKRTVPVPCFALLFAMFSLQASLCFSGAPEKEASDRAIPRGLIQPAVFPEREPGPLSPVNDCEQLEMWLADAITLELLRLKYAPPTPPSSHWDPPYVDFSCSDWNNIPSVQYPKPGIETLDLVRQDGKYLYFVHHSGLSVIEYQEPDSLRLLSEVELRGLWPIGLVAWDDHVAVFSITGYGPWTTHVELFNVLDPEMPVRVRTLDLPGNLVDARVIDGHLFFNLDDQELAGDAKVFLDVDEIDLPALGPDAGEEETWAILEEARAVLTPLVHDGVNGQGADSFLPVFGDRPAALPDFVTQPLMECSDVHVPGGYPSLGMHSVVHIDLTGDVVDDTDVDATGVFGAPWIVNYDADSLVAARRNGQWLNWEWDLEPPNQKTEVHRFDLSMIGPSHLGYSSSVVLPGWAILWSQIPWPFPKPIERINQNPIDVTGDLIRIATRDDAHDPSILEIGESRVEVSILWDNRQGDLARVGTLGQNNEGFGIHSVTFSGDWGFLISSREWPVLRAPLFVLDLSNPTQPAISGELEMADRFPMPFLQPLDDDHLLTVYNVGFGNTTFSELAAQVFKISNSKEPELLHYRELLEIDEYVDGGAYAYQDGTLIVPSYEPVESEPDVPSRSTLGVDPISGFERRGSVDHDDLDPREECRGAPSILRSLIIDDSLITLSNFGGKLSRVSDPDVSQSVVEFRRTLLRRHRAQPVIRFDEEERAPAGLAPRTGGREQGLKNERPHLQ